jgi:hypothetical protein
LRAREFLDQRCLIIRIAPPSVIREQRYVVIFCEEAEKVIGADFPSGIDREKFAGLNPQQSHLEFP